MGRPPWTSDADRFEERTVTAEQSDVRRHIRSLLEKLAQQLTAFRGLKRSLAENPEGISVG